MPMLKSGECCASVLLVTVVFDKRLDLETGTLARISLSFARRLTDAESVVR